MPNTSSICSQPGGQPHTRDTGVTLPLSPHPRHKRSQQPCQRDTHPRVTKPGGVIPAARGTVPLRATQLRAPRAQRDEDGVAAPCPRPPRSGVSEPGRSRSRPWRLEEGSGAAVEQLPVPVRGPGVAAGAPRAAQLPLGVAALGARAGTLGARRREALFSEQRGCSPSPGSTSAAHPRPSFRDPPSAARAPRTVLGAALGTAQRRLGCWRPSVGTRGNGAPRGHQVVKAAEPPLRAGHQHTERFHSDLCHPVPVSPEQAGAALSPLRGFAPRLGRHNPFPGRATPAARAPSRAAACPVPAVCSVLCPRRRCATFSPLPLTLASQPGFARRVHTTSVLFRSLPGWLSCPFSPTQLSGVTVPVRFTPPTRSPPAWDRTRLRVPSKPHLFHLLPAAL